MPLYELAIMGGPSGAQLRELEAQVSQVIELFGLHLDEEVGWSVCPPAFTPEQSSPAAAVFFGGPDVSAVGMGPLLQRGIPVLPIASADGHIEQDIPEQLRRLSCLTYAGHGAQRICTALLECVGLMPRQRRVFVSYKRESASAAALQLFNALSARLFEVFCRTGEVCSRQAARSRSCVLPLRRR